MSKVVPTRPVAQVGARVAPPNIKSIGKPVHENNGNINQQPLTGHQLDELNNQVNKLIT